MMLGRALTIATVLIGGLTGAQLPEFSQQYRQRIGGAVDELRRIIDQFDTDARASGLDRTAALQRFTTSADDFLKKRGIAAASDIARLGHLEQQQQRLREDNLILRVTEMPRADRDLMKATLRDFEPALPLTAEGGFFAAIGAWLMWLVVRLMTWPKRVLDRRLAYRRG